MMIRGFKGKYIRENNKRHTDNKDNNNKNYNHNSNNNNNNDNNENSREI